MNGGRGRKLPKPYDADEVRQHLIELHGMPPKLLVHETAESMRDGLHVVLHDDVGGPWSGHHEHAALYTRPEPS